MKKRIIRVGPAGWSYKDWEGVVYPQKPGKSFDPLEYLAQFFNTIEINSSFYRPPVPTTTTSWAKRVAANKEFAFTAKLHRIFTHERGKGTKKDEKEYRLGMDVLAGAGRLGGLLLQCSKCGTRRVTIRNFTNGWMNAASQSAISISRCFRNQFDHRR